MGKCLDKWAVSEDSIIWLIRYIYRRISMDGNAFWKPYMGQLTKKPLYHSIAMLQPTNTNYDAIITDQFILFGDMHIPFSFDLKFGIREATIYFEMDHDIMEFSLPQGDQMKWRDVLKNFLNQKGFHEAFKAIKKIGKGNFASVYLVEKNQNKCKYAVKAFSKQSAYNEENGKQCLIKEIEIMRHLEHPHLMKLQEVYESDNSLYIVFQLLEGGQLYQKIKDKYQFSPLETKQMMKGLLQGIREMHVKNIMHRDIKPENILIRSKNSLDLVIADFGLAEFAEIEEYLFVRCGTPGYVAPEVINIRDMKKKYSPICDIFSIGIIFHIFLFRHSIFTKKTYNEVLNENRACNFNFANPMYQEIPAPALDLLQKMLRINPLERITAQQALDHPYFRLTKQELQVSSPGTTKLPKLSPSHCGSMEVQKTKLDKDSCLQFRMGKENVVNGRTDTVAEVGKTKVSMFGKGLAPGRTSKISKFSTRPHGSP